MGPESVGCTGALDGPHQLGQRRDSIFWTGVVLLLLWVSHVPSLSEFPLRTTPGTQALSMEVAGAPEWIKGEVGLGGMGQGEIERSLLAASRRAFLGSLVLIVAGIVSAVLLLRRNRWGRFLAIGVALYVLLSRIAHHLSMGSPPSVQFAKFRMHLAAHPLRVIHGDILTLLVLLVVLAHLLRPGVARRFGRNLD